MLAGCPEAISSCCRTASIVSTLDGLILCCPSSFSHQEGEQLDLDVEAQHYSTVHVISVFPLVGLSLSACDLVGDTFTLGRGPLPFYGESILVAQAINDIRMNVAIQMAVMGMSPEISASRESGDLPREVFIFGCDFQSHSQKLAGVSFE